MRAKSFIYALLAMAVISVAASCQRYDEIPEPIKPDVTIVQNEVEGKPANFVSFTITTTNAVEGYWYIGDAINGMNYVVENGTKFTEESIVVEYTMPWNDTKGIWVLVISEDGTQAMGAEEISVGEEPTPEPEPEPETGMEFRAESRVKAIFWNNGYDLYFIFSNGEETRQLLLSLVVSDGANGLIPEGRYELGAEAPIYIDLGSCVMAPNGSDIADLESAILDVEYVGSEYRMVVDAVDSEGTTYKADWTGRVDASHSDYPIYHPGDEIPEFEEGEVVFLSKKGVRGGYVDPFYYIDFSVYDGKVESQVMLVIWANVGVKGVLPEGRYELSEWASPCILKDYSRVATDTGAYLTSLVSASLDVEYVGNEYRMVINAVDANGVVYEVDWTGRLVTTDSGYPIYGPSDEIPGPEEREVVFIPEEGVSGAYSSSHYYLYFGFLDGNVKLQLTFALGVTEGSMGLLPEGRYEIGEETPHCILNYYSRVSIYTGVFVADFVNVTIDVEHVGNEYRIVVNAVDTKGVVYEADWTGRLISSYSDCPVYNPGDEISKPTMALSEYYVPSGSFVEDNYYYIELFFENRLECRILKLYLNVEAGSGGVIPEGVYTYGVESLPHIGANSKIGALTGGNLAELVSVTLRVEHVGNEYRLVVYAEDSVGIIYEADWVGQIEIYWTDMPIYNPGEAPTE